MIPTYVKNEEKISSKINIIAHYDDVTLLDKNDKLIQIIKVRGLNYVSTDARSVDAYKNRLNNLLKSLSSEYALYMWEVRKKDVTYPHGIYPDGYADRLNARYKNSIQSSNMYKNELYLAIITKQSEGLMNRGMSFIQQVKQAFDKDAKQKYLVKRHAVLCDVTRKVMSSLSDYGCELLSRYEKNGVAFSAPLEFISEIINGDKHTVPLLPFDTAKVLPRKRLSFHKNFVEIHSSDNKSRFAAMLSIKSYSPVTYQGMLNEFGKLPCEYVITQSFRPYDRQVAKSILRDQQMEMRQSRDESISQTEQLNDAFDDAASGEVGFGLHHFTMMVYDYDQEGLNKHVGNIVSQFSHLDIACVREDIASECAFWAQFPGNFYYILRAAPISTRNMAGLASFHNYPQGKMTGNHWGDAVTVLKTQAGTPYYFNFHHKDVGNFLVFGSMGSGKTMLTGLLIAQSLKFGGKRVIFDKDRGLEILVRAMGGSYERIKPGIPTGFNPCQLADTPENRTFLITLLRVLLTPSSEAESETISSAIDSMYRLDPAHRQFCHLAAFFGARKAGSLRNRFDQWHSEGVHAWLFDNAIDNAVLGADVLGFDVGSILNDQHCKTPALMYLTYRIEQAMTGQRGLLFIDEGWLVLSDEYFRKLIDDWSRTPRKKNNIFGLATQVANDTVDSSISKSINESAFCKIFFPNASADAKVYIDHFGLTPHEYHLVKSLGDDQRYFLLVYGHGVNKESVVVRADLTELEDDIAIISAREHSLIVFDKIRAKVGDDPKVWLPMFKIRMKELKS